MESSVSWEESRWSIITLRKKDTSSCTELYFSTFNIGNFTKVAKLNSFKNEQKVNQIKQTVVVSNQRYPCLHIVSHMQRNVWADCYLFCSLC